MKAYFKKFAALTAAALLVLSMAACGGNDDTESTAPVDDTNSVVDNIPADDTNTSDEGTSGESDTAASETGSNDSQKETEGGNSVTPPANNDTLSKEEAVALFNKATASAKSMKGNRYTQVDLIDVPGGDFVKNLIVPFLPKASDATAISGVPNTTMNAADFTNVSASKSGNNWVITMTVKSENAPNHAANTRAFQELPQADIDDWINNKLSVTPSDSIKFAYSNGKIVATVSPDGKLINATYTMNVKVTVKNAKIKGIVSVPSAEVTVTQTDKF